MILPDESRTIRLYETVFRWGIGRDETDGALSMLEVTIPARTLIKPHSHAGEDEFSLVLSGTIGARTGDQVVEVVPAGSWLIKPRSVPHALWNVGDEPARVLEVITRGPGALFHGDRAHPARTRARVDSALSRGRGRYGLTILDDWTDELQERYGIEL